MRLYFLRPRKASGFRVLNARVCLLLLAIALVLALSIGPHETPVFEEIGFATATKSWPVFYVDTSEKALALTFDISWGTKTPPLVLAALEQMDQKATFFLSGPWARRYPDTVKAIVDAGHEIASHGEEHINLGALPNATISDNIGKAHATLKDLAGAEPRFFRPPNGDYSDNVVDVAQSSGYETVIWSIDSLDWKNPGIRTMVSRVTDQAFAGAIVLFHASDSSKETHLALPETLLTLRDAGYRVVTLGELWKMGEAGRSDPRGDPGHPARIKSARAH